MLPQRVGLVHYPPSLAPNRSTHHPLCEFSFGLRTTVYEEDRHAGELSIV